MSDDLRERIATFLAEDPSVPIAMLQDEADELAQVLLPLIQAEQCKAWIEGWHANFAVNCEGDMSVAAVGNPYRPVAAVPVTPETVGTDAIHESITVDGPGLLYNADTPIVLPAATEERLCPDCQKYKRTLANECVECGALT